jgi:AraC-like DNA-binding protein
MAMKNGSASTEVRRLKDCIGNLLSVTSIQAISRGSEPDHIIGALLEVLLGTLRLQFAYAEFRLTGVRAPIVLARYSRPPGRPELPRQIRVAVDAWLADKSRTSPFVIRCPSADGQLALALVSLGLHTEIGWLLVCSPRNDFPTQIERLILGVAANQAVIGVQQAQLQSEQTRVAQQLDRRVKQRTKELEIANAELGRALRQIDTLRDDLQRENVVLREQAAGARGGLAPWQLRRAEALMSQNLSVQVPLERVADECGLSVRHMARAFRQSTGVPPHRWLLDRRVERAKELLPDSKLSLSDVALACGFGDQSHFTRTFTAAVRLSPGLWRRLHFRRG